MNKSNMWITMLASAGVGAAAYYNLSKSSKPLDKAFETVAPMFSSTNNGQSELSQGQGGLNQGQSGLNQGQTGSNQYKEKETLGPHGMS